MMHGDLLAIAMLGDSFGNPQPALVVQTSQFGAMSL